MGGRELAGWCPRARSPGRRVQQGDIEEEEGTVRENRVGSGYVACGNMLVNLGLSLGGGTGF